MNSGIGCTSRFVLGKKSQLFKFEYFDFFSHRFVTVNENSFGFGLLSKQNRSLNMRQNLNCQTLLEFEPL